MVMTPIKVDELGDAGHRRLDIDGGGRRILWGQAFDQFLAIACPIFSGLLVLHNSPANFPIRRRHQRVHHADGRSPRRVQQFTDP